MSATMAGWQWIIKKKHWLKHPKAVPPHKKKETGPKFKWFKLSYLEFFFWKYYFGDTAFLYLSRCSSGHHQSFFLISDVLSQNQQKQKLAKQVTIFLQYSFAQKTSLILRTSTHLTLKIICSCNTAKNLSDFTNFPADMFLCSVRKDICTAPFLDAQELHSWSTLKANVCIFLYISL